MKFYLSDLPALEGRLKSLGAKLAEPRIHEFNLRFDTPGGEMTRSHQVLRLRRAGHVSVTYKGPARLEDGVSVRPEINLPVSGFRDAQALFEALGYRERFVYEKYRATYHLGNLIVVLDETPLGSFAEIEGPDSASIRAAAPRLGLDWDARLTYSYLALFQLAKASLGVSFRDLTFDNFQGIKVSPALLGARFADRT